VNRLRLRDYRRRQCCLLPRRLLGNGLWWAAGTTWALLPPRRTTYVSIIERQLACGKPYSEIAGEVLYRQLGFGRFHRS